MVKVTFVSQSSRSDDAVAFSPERLINLYPETAPEGAKGALLIRSELGQVAFAEIGVGALRAMNTINGVIYAVGSGKLFSISSGGTVSQLATLSDDSVTTIDGNGTDVVIGAGGNYYVWDGAALSQPGSGAFSSEGTVAFIDQRTIITERDGARFEWTDVADAKSRDALNVAANESKNDNTLRVLADRRELWFFGQESIEIWYNTQQGGADAFERINGGALETGALSASLMVKMDEGIFFIGDDRVAYVTSGMSLRPISTPAVNQSIEASTPTHCFYYEDMGHKFFAIRFSDRPAWVYDMLTGLWHERSTGVNHGPWDAFATTKAFGKWYVGTASGSIREMSRVNTDVGNPLKRTAVSRSLYLGGDQFSVAELEFLARIGESDIGRDAQVIARFSGDGGRTWSLEDTRSLGDIGDRTRYAVYRVLGRYRDFTAEFSITDPSDISFYSDANVKVT